MSEIGLLLLIDTDPPSEVGDGSRGFYPANGRSDGPDRALMLARLTAIAAIVDGEAGGRALLTLHTSPRYRDHFFRDPYAAIWRERLAAGTMLALHPHEERAEGGTHYDKPGHLAAVIDRALALAAAQGITLAAFRSGGFAFHPDLPRLLTARGFLFDCSAAPGHCDAARGIDWSATTGAMLDDGGDGLPEVPLGWSGDDTDLGRDYLFNERQDRAGLRRVWDGLRRRAEHRDGEAVVNFLAHGFGMVDRRWRDQATDFLDWACRHGGRLVGGDEAAALARAAGARAMADHGEQR